MRGVVVCMQMKSGSEASGNTGRIRTQFVAFHNFRALSRRSQNAKSLCNFVLLTARRIYYACKECSSGKTMQARQPEVQGTKGHTEG